MGTSKGYSAPTSPPWPDLKRKVSRQAPKGPPSNTSSKEILNDFITANGGPSGMTGGRGGKAVQIVARDVAGFISAIEDLGFKEALRRSQLENLIGKPADEISFALIDHLGGLANTIDDVDVRNALSRVMHELFKDAADYEDFERTMEANTSREELENFLTKFFGYYLFERFCRVFHERLVARVGESKAQTFLNGILEYIRAMIRNKAKEKDLSSIEWSGKEGQSIIEEILQETLEVFGG